MTNAGLTPAAVLVVTTLAEIIGAAIVFGSLMNRVKDLERRCAIADREIESSRAMETRLARVDERVESLLEQFRDLNYSIAWMRQPAAWGQPPPRERGGSPP